MRNLKTLTNIVGVVSFGLFFTSMTLLITSVNNIRNGDHDSIRAFLLGGKLMIAAFPTLSLFFWLEQKVTDRKYKELSQQGVPVTFL